MGPTIAVINHRHIRHNIQIIRDAVGRRKIMAVVKANAYGHGEKEVAQTAINSGCEYLGVAFPEEGIRLRNAGIKKPILVFGAHHPKQLKSAIEYSLEITITSEWQIDMLKAMGINTETPLGIHLKVDTGMNRVGFPMDQIEIALNRILNTPAFVLRGVYSHFATADDPDQQYARVQLNRFMEIMRYCNSKVGSDILFHMANSAAIMTLPDSYLDMVRPGIMLYGYPPSPDFHTEWILKEAMSLHSQLGLIKFIRKNEPISYGRRFYTKNDTYIGVIPAGYADGFSRMNTNQAQVCLGGKTFPVVGTVCMDMIMVDLGADSDHVAGDDVVLYGDKVPITEVARRIHTIPYEITCNVSERVPRIHEF